MMSPMGARAAFVKAVLIKEEVGDYNSPDPGYKQGADCLSD